MSSSIDTTVGPVSASLKLCFVARAAVFAAPHRCSPWTSTRRARPACCDACSARAKQASERDRFALSKVVRSERLGVACSHARFAKGCGVEPDSSRRPPGCDRRSAPPESSEFAGRLCRIPPGRACRNSSAICEIWREFCRASASACRNSGAVPIACPGGLATGHRATRARPRAERSPRSTIRRPRRASVIQPPA
jgi:hypothetical protein